MFNTIQKWFKSVLLTCIKNVNETLFVRADLKSNKIRRRRLADRNVFVAEAIFLLQVYLSELVGHFPFPISCI